MPTWEECPRGGEELGLTAPGVIGAQLRWTEPGGFKLLETLIAKALLVTGITGVAHLLVWSRRGGWASGATSLSAAMAVQKIEQLRALTWAVDGDGLAVSDATTDVSVDPPAAGGVGLATARAGDLYESVAGFTDYLDAQSAWRGSGTRPPAGAVFVRRWTVAPLAADPLHTLVIHVRVVPLAEDVGGGRQRSWHGAMQTTIRTRSLR
jgi:hypothetical protein